MSAPDALIPVVEELVRQLDDGNASAGDPVVRVKPLAYADAAQVAASLGQALASATNPATREPLAVKVIPAAGSNALLLVGPATDLDEAEKLIAPLDERPALDAVDAKTFALKNADSTRLAPLVQRLLSDQQETDPRIVLERMRRTRGQADAVPPVRVEPDPRTNSLIVSGASRIMAVAEGLIRELDRDGDAVSRTWSVFTPTKAPVSQLVDEARRVLEGTLPQGGSRLELSALPQSGTVVIVGTAEQAERAKALLAELDGKAFAAPEADFRVVQLRHVAPDVAVSALNGVLLDRSRWPAALVAAAKAGAPVMEPKAVADALNARVVVTAPSALMPVATQVLEQLDRPREGDAPAEIRVYPLSQAGAADVAKAVEQALAARAASRPNARKAAVSAEPTSNSIVVAADPAQLDEVDAVVRAIDVRGPRDAARVRTVFLKNARAEQMAPLVEQLLAGEAKRAERARPAAGASIAAEPELRVVADARLNAVVISATPGALDAAEQMLAQLDAVPGQGTERTVRVLTLRNADATEIARNLTDLFETDDGSETPPVIRVSAASNSLLVRATDRQFETIEGVVTKLDGAAVCGARALRSVPLDPSRGDAEEIARLLRRMLEEGQGDVEVISVEELLKRYDAPKPDGKTQGRAVPRTGDIGMPSWPPRLPARMADEPRLAARVAMVVAAATAQAAPADAAAAGERPKSGDGVTVAVDKDSNSLLLLGSPREIERALRLVEQAARTLPVEGSRIRAVRLPASSDPAKLASVVNGALARMTPAGGTAGDLAKRVAVVADEETRSLLVVSNDRDFESVGQLIATVARGQQAEQLVVKSYVLRNAGAARVAEALQSVVTQGGGAKLRSLAVTIVGDGAEGPEGAAAAERTFDPSKLRVVAEKGANAVTVMGSPEAVAFADRFIAFADREERAVAPEMRLLPLKHAKAGELARSLQAIFQARGRALSQQGMVVSIPEFAADERTNMVVVAGGAESAAEIERLLGLLDQPTADGAQPLETIALASAVPSIVAATIDKVVLSVDATRRASTQVVPDDAAGVLLVRAAPEVLEEIRAVVRETDRAGARQFPIRQLKLERADAARVATALQKLFDDRAAIASGGRARGARSVSVVGDARSSTLFVAAGEADFAEISELVKGFDAPDAAPAYDFKVYALKEARATELARTVEQMVGDMGRGADPAAGDAVSVRADEKRNLLVVAGRGDRFALVAQIVEMLDVRPAEGEQRVVRSYAAPAGDIDQVAGLVRDAIGERGQRPWEQQAPQAAGGASRVIPIARSRQIVVRATAAQHAEVASLLEALGKTLVQEGRQTAVIPVEFASPAELSSTLRQFLDDRAAGNGGAASTATIVASASGGALLVAGSADEIATIRDLVARLDQPQTGADRRSDIVVLRKGQATDIARMVGEQFKGRGGSAGVAITPDVRTNSVLVSAPSAQFEQVRALIERLDAPSSAEESIIRTFTLTGAKADDAVKVLTTALQLDAKGRTQGVAVKVDEAGPAVQVNARIVADRRSNSIVVTATAESFPVIEKLLSQLEQSPSRVQVEYRIIALRAANATEVAGTLDRLVGGEKSDGAEPARIEADPAENRLIVASTPEQYEMIRKVVEAIDVAPVSRRITEFVTLKAAKARGVQEALGYFYGRGALDTDSPAKKSVRIVADEGTNALVVSAEESEWPAIRELVAKLDDEQYDGSRQLRVVGLKHADAKSVAAAINEAFKPQPIVAPPAPRGAEQQPIVVQQKTEELVTASADAFSNNLVVAASPANMRKIDAIVAQLDQPDFSQLPPPQLIQVRYGNPEQLARAIDRVYGP
ncbi:MAG: secretin N-terminal domain-containing protein, partial [Planctomycetota bacterium]